jgi:hypothetical protein
LEASACHLAFPLIRIPRSRIFLLVVKFNF